jgi:hypothetical protein
VKAAGDGLGGEGRPHEDDSGRETPSLRLPEGTRCSEAHLRTGERGKRIQPRKLVDRRVVDSGV